VDKTCFCFIQQCNLREKNLGNYRNRIEIVADILHVVRREAKKTQIMYQANLSYRLLSKYLMEVRRAYLINFERRKRCYVLTSKGIEFLERYKEYSKRNRHVTKQLNDVNGERRVLEKLCSAT
jgi:predicted transcriptional regulator